MILRADHIAGALFVAAGLLVFALSGDLPFGSLAFPGAGFLPKLLAAMLIVLGALLALAGAQSKRWQDLDWDDLKHALPVLVITAAAVALYTWLGFIITLPLMIFVLLTAVERKRLLPAALYSLTVTLLAYAMFVSLRAPVPLSPFGY
jgi:hypothetical protein